MIKRRFYKLEHRDRDSLSSSSSSSSSESEDSDPEDGGREQEDDGLGAEEVEKKVAGDEKEREKPTSPSAGSGYESEDSSGIDIDCDSTGLLFNDCEEDAGKGRQNLIDSQTYKDQLEGTKRFVSKNITKTIDSKDPLQAEMVDFVLKCKSVFKCRICPRIVCLSQDTLLAHLRSKRHARSKKLLGEGRLKLMLNSVGEVEEEEETHAERHARTVALAEKTSKKNKGRQRQKKRRRRKLCNGCDGGKPNPPQKKQIKRRKIED